jgi:2Fe-2S ferredoxin
MLEVTFLPGNHKINVRPGTSILAASRKAGVHIRSRCGGVSGCLMCKVTIKTPSALEKIKDSERRKLGSLVHEGVRLACQACILTDVVVQIPEDPMRAAVRRQMELMKNEEGGTLW